MIASAEAERLEAREAMRLVLGLVVAFGGTLGAIVLAFALAQSDLDPLAQVGLWNLALLAAGGSGGVLMGRGALRASLGRGAAPRWWPVGLAGGLATLAAGWAWLALLAHLSDAADEVVVNGAPWIRWLAIVIAPPLVEEWLCRGVLWEGTRRAAGERSAWVATSVLFAFLHGPGGGTLGLPHRLVAGAVFGWLRLRSESLLPGILAHAVNNALALALLGG